MIRRDPRMDEAYFRRGFAYSNLGQYQRAIQDFDEVIRLKPRSAEAYANRGSAFNMLGQQQRDVFIELSRIEQQILPGRYILMLRKKEAFGKNSI